MMVRLVLLGLLVLATATHATSSQVQTVPIRENGMLRGPMEEESKQHERRMMWSIFQSMLSTFLEGGLLIELV